MGKAWTTVEIQDWVESQDEENYWYQTIPVCDGIVTPGTVDSRKRLELLDLPDLTGKTVLDVGCNSGMYSFECRKRNASRVVGIDLQRNRLEQARVLNEIMDLDVEFKEMDLFEAKTLGQFDVVICIAMVTEVTDLIGALLILKEITREVLYLELALASTYRRNLGLLGKELHLASIFELNLDAVLNFRGIHGLMDLPGIRWLKPPFHGSARLRKIKTGWALVPDMQFVETLMADKFEIIDLGPSVRYHLLKLVNKSIGDSGKQKPVTR
jgi:SAM-dependent methyltransferase